MKLSPEQSIRQPLAPEKRRALLRLLLTAAAFIAACAAFYYFLGRPLLRFVGDGERFRAWVDGHGAWGRLAFLGMTVLQIVIAVLPGEPFEIAAGYAFGAVEGTGLCMLGALIGGTAVFLFVRRFGAPLVYTLFPREQVERVRFLRDPKRLNLIAFLLFFIPGTPKDLLTYCAGLTPMRLSVWLLITSAARLPSIVTSTVAGGALGRADYRLAAIVFAATLLVSLAGLLLYRGLGKRPEKKGPPVDP